MRDASICRRKRESSNKDAAAGEGGVAFRDSKDAVNVVDDSGGDREVGGGMVSEGEMGCYCSYFC